MSKACVSTSGPSSRRRHWPYSRAMRSSLPARWMAALHGELVPAREDHKSTVRRSGMRCALSCRRVPRAVSSRQDLRPQACDWLSQTQHL